MTHTVTTPDFEGPLALLLDLVERRQLEVTEISIAAITADYLEQVKRLVQPEPENLSEFLQLGARLLYIKSLALLPREPAEEQVEELRQLNLELAAYRRYQQAAQQLSRSRTGSSWRRPTASSLPPEEHVMPDISLEQLAAAFARALRQAEPTKPPTILRPPISQAAIAQRLRRQLRQGPIELQHLLDRTHDRLEIVVTFLTVLELIKQSEVRVTQTAQFAPVMMESVHV